MGEQMRNMKDYVLRTKHFNNRVVRKEYFGMAKVLLQ